MKTSAVEEERRGGAPARKPSRRGRLAHVPAGYLAVAAIPLGLLAYYLTSVAPDLFPFPEGMKVPFPALSGALEPVCEWCGKNPEWVYGLAAALVLAGFLFPVFYPRYYTGLAVTTAICLGLCWYLISAPVDRLIKNVEDNIPKDQRFQDPLKK
jgi:hypothetical protein